MPALDGLRGLAVLMVVISHISSYHAELLGPAGVAIFFVLSGFLITSLLLKEQDRWGKVSLTAFYVRRGLRLFPALLLLLLLTPLLLLIVSDPRLHSVFGGLLAALLYVQDFASATGHVGIVPHAWSLSVEEQFYLVWPAVLIWILSRTREDRSRLVRIVGSVTVVAAVWHVISASVFTYDWTYYAPDTNAVFLLAGCSLATWGRLERPPVVPTWVAAFALAAVCLLPLALTRIPTGEWRESTLLMFPVALGGAVVVLGASQLKVLNFRVLRWFGTLSYGIYLWNYVLISLEPHGRALTGSERAIAAVAAIGLAAASWYLVESPILRLKRNYQRVPDAPVEPAVVPITPWTAPGFQH